jgi:hypothetical protein
MGGSTSTTLVLKTRMGRAPVPYLEWTNQLASRDTEELQPMLDGLEQLKAEGLTGRRGLLGLCPLRNEVCEDLRLDGLSWTELKLEFAQLNRPL